MKQTAIVLQGGGALGAYELGVLKYLYASDSFSPNIISGVSIGAINAATLIGAKDDPIQTLEAIWDELTVFSAQMFPENAEPYLSLFGNAAFYHLRTDYWSMPYWTNFYTTTPLQQLLLKYIDFDKLNNSPIHLILTATDVTTGKSAVFENQGTKRTEITPLHVLASGSLPPGFPMTLIGNTHYWDGGLFSNTPLSPVMEKLNPDPNVEKQIIVINLFPSQGKIPTNMPEVFDRVFEIIFSNKIRFNTELTEKINEYIETIQEIEKVIPENSLIRQLPGYKRLLNYKYIQDIIYIESSDEENATASFDFSRKAIQRRINAGYKDAQRFFN
ncbi:patatin-like phospholipase family protein [Legionella pneumophila serogroup 1]|uniref:patatin-like phospholipase family protein n=1 Tax=Legionella pneumophila TaxID=446 RepID=UPI0005B446B9|nr:patatin-like phospholipase family protein [Legionella pneumophila]AMQ28206.1 phospholipase [Legionella pneumophila subsp. pneumophila]AMV14704.1 Patatin-like phospholipase [Legionella pneumophila]ANN92908.1 phospholipase [Legionella pneumophila]MBN5929417.1 patatin-like phospholipase family protein [Legionella pneumophila]MCZ4677531.1 patatin-like phospholipase family protein [Legionella pneumophila]